MSRRPSLRASPPFPGGGAGGTQRARYRRRIGTFLACIAAAAGTLASAQDGCDGQSGELSYSLGLDGQRRDGSTDVSTSFRLLAADGARDVAMLVFADGIQILGPTPVRRVDCGDAVRWRTRVQHAPDAPLDLHASAQPSPGIPPAFEDPPGRIPDGAEALRFAYDAADVATTAFGPPRDPPEGTWHGGAERTEAPTADAYLFDGAPDAPVHVRVLEPGEDRWTFRIWFGETLRRGGAFGITCLLNDRQFDGFSGRPLWYGVLAVGEAAVIPVRTPSLEPGWHQVRCLVLDSLFQGEERGPAWPYVIRSTYLYRRP